MGLINRVAPQGQARTTAETLAHELARFPQLCLRADRLSTVAVFDAPLDEALRREFYGGLSALWAEGVIGAARFAVAEERHGGAPGRSEPPDDTA